MVRRGVAARAGTGQARGDLRTARRAIARARDCWRRPSCARWLIKSIIACWQSPESEVR